MAKMMGFGAAQTWGNLHESFPKNPQCMKEMDLYNNSIGRKNGLFSGNSCDSYCATVPLQNTPKGSCQPCSNSKPAFPF
jgi:hypothetical protein